MFLLADGSMRQKERRRNYVQHLNKRIEMCRPKASTKERKEKERSNRKKDGELRERRTSSPHYEEATKGLWWMPRRQMPTKDVGHCEKPRGAVNKRRSGDVRMGKPTGANLQYRILNT